MIRHFEPHALDLEIAFCWTRLQWVEFKLTIGCFLMLGTTVAEFRRRRRWQELAGRTS